MSATVGYNYGHNEAVGHHTDDSRTPLSDVPETSPEAADSMLNTSNDDDDAHADAQLLSASILATIQSTPRHHATPNRFTGPNGTPNSTSKSSSSTPYHNGRHSAHDSYTSDYNSSRDESELKDRRNGKTTNNNMYPPSPTANITPRRRSTRVVKSAKPFPLKDNEREKRGEKEKEKGKGLETPSKRDNKSVSGSSAKKARKRLATANEADEPQPVPVLGRNLDLTTLLRSGTGESENPVISAEMFADPAWAESVSLYSLARSWMCAGVDLDPFHILRLDAAESVLVDMHDYISPPSLPPPSTSEPPALPERPRYPSSNSESFEAALKKGCDTTPKALLKSYVGNCKTFRTWWKANYTQRLSKYKGRLAVLFPTSEQGQPTQQTPSRPAAQTTTHLRTPSPSPQQSQHSEPQQHSQLSRSSPQEPPALLSQQSPSSEHSQSPQPSHESQQITEPQQLTSHQMPPPAQPLQQPTQELQNRLESPVHQHPAT
jgi:hypothetical protein